MPSPLALLDAFLAAHAGGQAVPLDLYARGESLLARLHADPPADPRWARFLIALGELAAERLGDDAAAEPLFRRVLAEAARPGAVDGEAVVTAGYDLGVLRLRAGDRAGAQAAWNAAARDGLRQGALCANLLRAALAALDGALAEAGEPDQDLRALAKQAWLAWLWLRRQEGAAIPAATADGLRRTLALLLLPADPLALAARWRAWPPTLIPVPGGVWRDGDPACLAGLFAAAAEAAPLLPGGGQADAYRLLAAAAARSIVRPP